MNEEVRPEYIGNYLCESNRHKNVMVIVRRDLYSIAKESVYALRIKPHTTLRISKQSLFS